MSSNPDQSTPVQTAHGSTMHPRKQVGRAWVWTVVALAAAAVAGGYWWHQRSTAAAAGGANAPAAGASAAGGPGGPGGAGGGSRRFGGGNNVQPVSVRPARLQDIRVMANAIGSLTASNTAVVHAQVSGVLQSLNFQEGQQVKAGQLLAQIDPRALQAAASQSEGALARDAAQLENARIDLARYKDLLSKDAAPKQQVDTQQALVRQLEGTVKVDQGALDAAKLQLSYTRVLAPISGRVGLKQVDLGNIVQTSDTNGIVSIAQTRPMALVFAIPSTQVPLLQEKLAAKQALTVQAWDKSGAKQLATGQVATIDNAIDATTDTIKVKALFPNKDDALFPNQSVTVKLQLNTLSNVLSVPSAAVLRGTQGFYVYVVGADSTVSTRNIKPGVVDGDWTAVEGDVKPGEKVVVDGVDRLRNGAKVEVVVPNRGGQGGQGNGNWGGKGANGAAGAASSPASAASGSKHAAKDGAKSADSAAQQPTAAATEQAPAADGSSDARRAFFQSLSPEEREKLRNMTPEERQAFREKMRAKNGGQAAPAN